jgi:2-amino-4-hydroxy-6-hydroxymethyldihydropteridine diphosphokinase
MTPASKEMGASKETAAMNDLAVIALGSNLKGDFASTEALLEAALQRLTLAGFKVLRRSSWWRSASWPDPKSPHYLNGVALVETALGPAAALEALRAVEVEFGRVRGPANAPRTLDLDLIAHGRVVQEEADLVLPHPRAADRLFVMGPLAEIGPGWVHPVLGKTAAALAERAGVGLDAYPALTILPGAAEAPKDH